MNVHSLMSALAPIGKIFNIANFDIKNNWKSWLNLLTVQAVVCVILNVYHFLPGSFEISFVDVFFGSGSFEFALGDEYFGLGFDLLSCLLCMKLVLAILLRYCAQIFFPIMILQNALDLAFDSKMRGFSVKGPFIIYVVMIHLFFIVRNIGLDKAVDFFESFYLIEDIASWYDLMLLFCFLSFIFFMYNYIFQTLRFVGLHLFEYQLGVKKSVQASYEMTRHKILFLSVVSIMQMFVFFLFACVAGSFLYVGASFIDRLLSMMPVSLLSFEFLYVFENCFAIILGTIFWSSFIAWYYLVEAHTYRLLVCPASDKPGCSSCECGV